MSATLEKDDPFKIAEIFGIRILFNGGCHKDFKVQAIKFKGYAPYIVISDKYTDSSQKVLCAHELGHIFLHDETLNNFANVGGRLNMETEYEANLFALALLEDPDNLNVKMTEITPYLLQNIVEDSVKRI